MSTTATTAPAESAIINGDCVALLDSLADATIDLAICDPPYNIGYGYDVHNDSMPAREYEAWCANWFEGVHRVLTATGSFWLIIGDEWAAELIVLAKRTGFTLRNWVVWHYTFGQHCHTKFTRSHAHLLHFTKGKGHTFRRDAVKVPSARQLVYNDKRAAAGGRTPDDVWVLRPQWLPEGFTEQHDTWFVPRVNGTFKEKRETPNQLPEQLVARLVEVSSYPGQVVLDPTAGSGTVPIVAKKLGRVGLGFELSEKYAAAAQAALDAVHVGDPIA